MANSLRELREKLLRAGVAPRHVRRYLVELRDHLADLQVEEERSGLSRPEAEAAALRRLGGTDSLASAMIQQRHFQAWCVRAPWAIFTLAPFAVLATAYFVACLILWSGWTLYLPAEATPFVRVDGFAVYYFGLGRLIYYSAPVFVGWWVVFTAARQRLKPTWPAVGLLMTAWLGATAHVYAVRSVAGRAVRDVSLHFTTGQSVQSMQSCLARVLFILAMTVLPYLVWRVYEVRVQPHGQN